MKKFAYRFQSILNIRELQEEEAARNFRMAMQDLTECLEQLDGFRMEYRSLVNELSENTEKVIDINMRLMYSNYLKVLDKKIENQFFLVQEKEKFVEEKRVELVEAVKEKKILENLKVKDLDKYLLELRRWEQEIIDDLTIQRGGYGREEKASKAEGASYEQQSQSENE